MKTHFKVDTGADGNLLPLGEFFKYFPEANLNDLAKTVSPHTKLYAYNNTETGKLVRHHTQSHGKAKPTTQPQCM